MEYFLSQPVRYLVDWSAAWALVSTVSFLKSCLGMTVRGFDETGSQVVRDFVQNCASALSRTLRTKDGSRGVQAIEMTITYRDDIEYSDEALYAMAWLPVLHLYLRGPMRPTIIYKSPLSQLQLQNEDTEDLSDTEEDTRDSVGELPREVELGDQDGSERRVFVRPLEEEAFERHVEGLEWY